MAESHELSDYRPKKTYKKLKDSPFSEDFKPSFYHFFGQKKIIPTIAHSNMREDFKKLFLPLLIDVFELRQMLTSYKLHKQHPDLYLFNQKSKTPTEIMKRLRQIQIEIEESQRWCEGVILQISKGLSEAQETLQGLGELEKKQTNKQKFSFKSFVSKWKELLWKRK